MILLDDIKSLPGRRLPVLSGRVLLIISLFLSFIHLSGFTRSVSRIPGEEKNPALEAGLKALRDGDAPLAVTLLRSSAVEEVLSAEALIGLGVAYRRIGRLSSSLQVLSRVEQHLSGTLRSWIQFYHAQVLIAAGSSAAADSMLNFLAVELDGGPLRAEVMGLRLEIARGRGEQGLEISILEDMVERREGDAAASADRLAEIVSESNAGKAAELRSRALALPGSDEARGRSAGELISSEANLEPRDLLTAGRTLFDLADWNGAERAFRMVLSTSEDPNFLSEARYRLGVSLYRKRSYREAAEILSEVGSTSGRYRTVAAYYSVLAIAASSNRRAAADALVSFTDRFPTSQYAPRTLRMAGDRLVESDYQAARKIYTRLVSDYPTHWGNADILFKLGRGAGDGGESTEAIQWYLQLGRGVYHPYEKAQGWFWAARMAGASGDSASASTYFTRAGERYPDTYYGALSLIELGRELPEPIRFSEINNERELVVPEWADHSLSTALILLRVGLSKEGEAQLQHALRRRSLSRDQLYGIWELSVEGLAYGAAVQIGERLLRTGTWEDDDPRFRELSFPIYYSDLIIREAYDRDLDPFLVLALIKQESAFVPDARSYVGARGLMQLMPATADDWARRLRLAPVEDEDLYEPDMNLRLGIPYLARLVNQFDGSIEKALAAYNAGAANVRRWERGLIDGRPETFIESIGFSETRTFVRTILNNYYRYRYLWSLRTEG